MKNKIHLLIIDPQNDFVMLPKDGATLSVNGADFDMERLSKFIKNNINKFQDIHVTLDSHHPLQVFHPLYWRDINGKHPDPFTRITIDDVESGKWNTTVPTFRTKALEYIKALDASQRYTLVIWPEHCLIGSWGTQVEKNLFETLTEWERKNIGMVNYVTKGSNMFTEHYSAVKAEVPDPKDPSTQINSNLIDILKEADIIFAAGEAFDYCFYNTLKDIIDNFGADQVKKIRVLKDCTSAIDPSSVNRIEAEFKALGVEFVTTLDAF